VPESHEAPRDRAWAVTALALYGTLALALNAPLLPHFTTAVPSDIGDPLLNTWILWWNAQAAPWASGYWNAPAFAPAPSALALSETLLGLTPITTPLQWLGAAPLTAYNVLFVLTPFLNGAAAYALCRALTARGDAALIGGLYFMLAPYRAAQLPHVQTLATFYMPLALLGLHAYWRSGQKRWLACLFVATVANGLVSGYHLVYFALPLAVALVWVAASSTDWRRPAAIAGTLVTAGVTLLPVLIPYERVHANWNLRRGIGEMLTFSADLGSFLSAAPWLWLGPLPKLIDKPEADVYPGLALVGCLALGLIAWWPGRNREAPAALPAWARTARFILWSVAALATLAAIVGLVRGPFGLGLGSVRVSVTALNKPIGAALSALLVSAALSPRTWSSARRGAVVGLYVTIFVAATVLMLGPEGQVLGARFWYKAPSAWLLELPGFDSVRVPARWASIQILAGAVLSACAVAAWRRPAKRSARPLIAVLVGALTLDGWYILPIAATPTPLPLPVRAELVVELPVHGWVEDVAAMYHGMSHGRPVVNGYSGYGPPHYSYLTFDLQRGCLDSLDAVRGGRSLDVVVHTDAEAGASTVDAVRRRWPDAPEDQAGGVVVRHVPAVAARAAPAHDDPIDLRDFCQAVRLAAAESP
jgi:hypothetical protein